MQNLKPCSHCGGEAKAELSKVKNNKYVCVVTCTRCQRLKTVWEQSSEEEYVNEGRLRHEASALWNNAADDMKLYNGEWIPFRTHVQQNEREIMNSLKEGKNEETIAKELGVPTKYIYEFLHKDDKKG